MSQIPVTLIKKFKSNNITPIVGAGVSQSIKDKQGRNVFPSWKLLLEKSAEKLRDEAKEDYALLVETFIRKNNYGQAAKYAHEGLEGANWINFFKELFDPDLDRLDKNSAALPKAIWGLSNQIITLNYDRVLQWAHTNSAQVSTIDKNSEAELADFQQVSDKPTVWHLHGKIDNSAELILTPDSYDKLYSTTANAKASYDAALETLKIVSSNRSLLFIGCSLDDAELLSLIHIQQKIFAGNTGPHYALVRKENYDEIEAKLNGTNIQLITFEDFGAPLINLINEISQYRAVDKSEDNQEPSNNKTDSNPGLLETQLDSNLKPKIFISYGRDASHGQNLATEAQQHLQEAGFQVFRDVIGLKPGDVWYSKLEFELESSDLIVLVVSEKVRKSQWVYNEISMAQELGLPIIPVIAEIVRMPLWLRHLQILDFSEQKSWPELLSAIEGHVGLTGG